jgi:ABC-type polysaccharide/polyol phosphate transport system ATPase subunit
MPPVLEVERVSKSFRIPSVRRDTLREHAFALFRPRRFERLEVLNEISFALGAGETLGIMGRNGCGKSTLLKIVCGIYPPDSGAVRRHAPLTPILELGVGFNPDLDAVDNVFLVGTVMGLSLAELRRDLDQILAFAELERFAQLELKHFSSGMASRLAYAVAFQAVRDVLVLDEIYAVGDAGFKAKCAERHRQFAARGTSTLVVAHEPGTVASICDRALLLERGAIVAAGSGAEIAARYLELVAPPCAPS